jgi:hypothetical protein
LLARGKTGEQHAIFKPLASHWIPVIAFPNNLAIGVEVTFNPNNNYNTEYLTTFNYNWCELAPVVIEEPLGFSAIPSETLILAEASFTRKLGLLSIRPVGK